LTQAGDPAQPGCLVTSPGTTGMKQLPFRLCLMEFAKQEAAKATPSGTDDRQGRMALPSLGRLCLADRMEGTHCTSCWPHTLPLTTWGPNIQGSSLLPPVGH
jgi:hypothetical protein